MFKWRPGKVEEETEVRPKKRHMLSPGHVKDSFRTFFKKRPDNKRFYILIYVTMLLMYYLPFFGEGAVSYNYVRTRLAIIISTESALLYCTKSTVLSVQFFQYSIKSTVLFVQYYT